MAGAQSSYLSLDSVCVSMYELSVTLHFFLGVYWNLRITTGCMSMGSVNVIKPMME